MPRNAAQTPLWEEELDFYKFAPIGLCLLSADLLFLRVNEVMADINGVPAAEHLGKHVRDVVPDLEAIALELMEKVVVEKQQIGPFEVSGQTPSQPGVERCWIEIWSPIFDSDGNVIAATISALEVTDKKQAERQKEEALREAERLLRHQTALSRLIQRALEELPLSVVIDDAVATVSNTLDAPMVQVLAFEGAVKNPRLIAGTGWKDGYVGNHIAEPDIQAKLGYTHIDRPPVIVKEKDEQFSASSLLREHQVRSGISVTIAGKGETPFGILGVYASQRRKFDQADASFLSSVAAVIANAAERERAATERSILIREMTHRGGNLLQLIGAIASQSFKGISDGKALSAFKERLAALSRSNHVIANGGWTTTNFRTIIHETLLPFVDQLDLAGNDVVLSADLSFDLALVLHELATNSCKYGSLGARSGKVFLHWWVRATDKTPYLMIEWFDPETEKPEHETPSSTGFGSRLIYSLVTQKWQGSVSIERADGYRLSISIPLPMA